MSSGKPMKWVGVFCSLCQVGGPGAEVATFHVLPPLSLQQASFVGQRGTEKS